ncbi:alpha/beta hydrolase [Arthrobacter sp. NPDC090010]|uniref:alpha/beta hydrolase n=1 Tax=Arthrobacter sp. NPDC090010 TaxID=3363942 RepID=UPI0037FBB4AA
MTFWKPILDTTIIEPKFLMMWSIVSALVLVYLIFKKRKARWFLTAAIALFAGIVIGLGILWYIVYVDNTFGEPLLPDVWFWFPAALGAILLAVVNLRGGRWWRPIVSVLSVLVFLVTAAFQINAAYGLNPTLASLLNINTDNTVHFAPRKDWRTEPANEPLYKSWTPPKYLAKYGAKGKTPTQIPNTHSGFPARWSGLYLPPAALVHNPPRLPFVIMMNGQPGSPTAQIIGNVADSMAVKHHGLAPIILVVDQLGDPTQDPMCLNSPLGNVETYVMKDVLPWARANLPILQDRKYWTFMGYSNGGTCASYFANKYPQDFGSYVSISGEEFQGSDKAAQTLANFFNGDQAAYDAVKPRNIMVAHGKYHDMFALYTAGSKDLFYTNAAKRSIATAHQEGIQTEFYSVPGAGHVGNALAGGLFKAFAVMYPRWGLSPS